MPEMSRILEILPLADRWGNSVSRWLIAAAATLAIASLLQVVKATLAVRLNSLAQRRAATWLPIVEQPLRRTRGWFQLLVAICGGACLLNLPQQARHVLYVAAVLGLLWQAALWADAILRSAVARCIEERKAVDAASVTTLSALAFLGRLAIWTAAVVLAAANLGINVTALVAGLGIGGVAVALAAQNVLADLFASVSIVLDRPFVLGDFIVIDDKMGSVEHIGLKTTRLRSLTGEQLVFSNTDLLKSRLHNYQRLVERRVSFSIGVAYETPYETLEAIPDMLREIVQLQPSVRFDRAHFARYGDAALMFEVVYYFLGADYNRYMDAQQAINLAVFRRFSEQRIVFAYPGRTIQVRPAE
jgi:small-conductance mechanosensitive channel